MCLTFLILCVLYESKEVNKVTGKKTTMAEAQLIGRGARYFPFKTKANQSLFKRKFDDDPQNELRICEELYYHSPYNPSYIDELHKAMIESGIKAAPDEKNISSGKNKLISKDKSTRIKKMDLLAVFQKQLVCNVYSGKSHEGIMDENEKACSAIAQLTAGNRHRLVCRLHAPAGGASAPTLTRIP